MANLPPSVYKEIITNSADAVVILDPLGYYLEQNPAHQRLFGYSDDDLRGKTPAIHAGEELFEKVARELQEKGNFRGEITSHTREGLPIQVELLAFCVTDEAGELTCYVAFARDIGERKRVEARRRVQQRVREEVWKMRGADDIKNVLVAIRDGLESLEIPYQNCGINVVDDGESPSVRSHSMTREGGWLVPETEEAVETVVRLWRSGEPTYRGDLESEDPLGECDYLQRHERIRAVLDVPFSHGTLEINSTQPNAFSAEDIAVLQELARVLSEGFQRMGDLEDLDEAHTQLMQSEKMAALGNLMAGIAHEINTPVGAIHSMQDTLVRAVEKLKEAIENDFPESSKEHRGLQRALKIIEDSNRVIETGTQRVTTIVRSLRNFARMDQGELKEVDIHQGLEDTLMLVHHDIKNRIEVVKNYGEVPPLCCYSGRLNQVFLNILNNAQQAIDGKGTITVSTFLLDGEVHIATQDTGSGIPEENLKKLFDPTFTTKPTGAGTGLGLSICHQIVEEHKGRIEVESTVGSGTVFEVILPLDACRQQED